MPYLRSFLMKKRRIHLPAATITLEFFCRLMNNLVTQLGNICDMRRLVPVLFFLILLSCRKENSDLNPSTAYTGADLAYGKDAAEKMDIYLPAGRTVASTKFIVIIHGGAWSDGDKSDFTAYVDSLKLRFPGYAFFNINYRLYKDGHNKFPAQEEDVKAAVEFILDKAPEYQLSVQYVLVGASAGGHLALLEAYKNSKVLPKAVVSFFGPTDLTRLYKEATNVFFKGVLAEIIGTTPDLGPDIYQESSPIEFSGSQSCPTLLLHGDQDELVPLSQSELLKNKLDQYHIANKLVVYPGLGHGWFGEPLTDSFNQMQSFIQEHVH